MEKHSTFKGEDIGNTIQVPGMALRSNAWFPTPQVKPFTEHNYLNKKDYK